jgi:hypothetical protein
MRYADFTLVLSLLKPDSDGIAFAVQAPDTGISDPVPSRLAGKIITELLRASPTAPPAEPLLIQHGCELARALFPAGILERFRRARVAYQMRGMRMRLRLLGEAGFHRIPWELAIVPPEVGEPTLMDALALDPQVSLSREPQGVPPRWNAMTRSWPVTVLAVAASPAGSPSIDVARERADLDAIGAESSRVRFEWVENGGVPARASRPAEVFHFAGHGGFSFDVAATRGPAAIIRDIVLKSSESEPASGQGSLLFEDGQKGATTVDASTLGVLLRDLGIQIAVINACRGARRDTVHAWSSVAASLLKSGVGNVLAMQHDLLDTSAHLFATAFYGAWSEGSSLDDAVYRARIAILRGGDGFGWASPVLYRSLEAPDPRPDPLRVELAAAPSAIRTITWSRDGRGVMAATADEIVGWCQRGDAIWERSYTRGVEAIGDRLVSDEGPSKRELARTELEIRTWAASLRAAFCVDAGESLYAFDAEGRVIDRTPLAGSRWVIAAIGSGDDAVALFTPEGELAVWKVGRRVARTDLGVPISAVVFGDSGSVIALSNGQLIALAVVKRALVRATRSLVDQADIRAIARASRADVLALQVDRGIDLFRVQSRDSGLVASRFMTIEPPDVTAFAVSPDGTALVTVLAATPTIWRLASPVRLAS